ncbi:MAG: DUF3151 domain-containing protein [Acidimicrobiales bacterium]|nr:DUF3151 domain-containing protein [Acidimicrobiales bacterium]
MDNDHTAPLTSRPPETILPEPPQAAQQALERARLLSGDARRQALVEVVADHPTLLDGWADLAEVGRDRVESYAYARVGYHRGLDALRGAGWRGSGYVRWSQPANRGFLRSLDALRTAAAQIGETGEAERCEVFLRQLDPEYRGERQ